MMTHYWEVFTLGSRFLGCARSHSHGMGGILGTFWQLRVRAKVIKTRTKKVGGNGNWCPLWDWLGRLLQVLTMHYTRLANKNQLVSYGDFSNMI